MKEDRLKEWNGAWRWFVEVAENNPSELSIDRDVIRVRDVSVDMLWSAYRYGSPVHRVMWKLMKYKYEDSCDPHGTLIRQWQRSEYDAFFYAPVPTPAHVSHMSFDQLSEICHGILARYKGAGNCFQTPQKKNLAEEDIDG